MDVILIQGLIAGMSIFMAHFYKYIVSITNKQLNFHIIHTIVNAWVSKL